MSADSSSPFAEHVERLSRTHLRDLLKDSARGESLRLRLGPILLDLSRQKLDAEALDALRALQEKGAIDAGMLPKAKAVTDALEGGVKRVHLVGFRSPASLLVEIFTNEGAGTLIEREASKPEVHGG